MPESMQFYLVYYQQYLNMKNGSSVQNQLVKPISDNYSTHVKYHGAVWNRI